MSTNVNQYTLFKEYSSIEAIKKLEQSGNFRSIALILNEMTNKGLYGIKMAMLFVLLRNHPNNGVLLEQKTAFERPMTVELSEIYKRHKKNKHMKHNCSEIIAKAPFQSVLTFLEKLNTKYPGETNTYLMSLPNGIGTFSVDLWEAISQIRQLGSNLEHMELDEQKTKIMTNIMSTPFGLVKKEKEKRETMFTMGEIFEFLQRLATDADDTELLAELKAIRGLVELGDGLSVTYGLGQLEELLNSKLFLMNNMQLLEAILSDIDIVKTTYLQANEQSRRRVFDKKTFLLQPGYKRLD